MSLAQALERDDPEADEAVEAASFDATTLVRRPFGGVFFVSCEEFLETRREVQLGGTSSCQQRFGKPL